jgi:hypothetical protein
MGEDANSTESSAATQPTEGTASPSTETGSVATQEAAPTAAESAPEANTEDEIWARLSELDPDEVIRRNPKLQGKVGSLAQQQAQRALAQRDQERMAEMAQQARQRERAELRRLAEENPDALAARVVADTARAEMAERDRSLAAQAVDREHQKLAGELNALYQKPIIREIWEQADEATRSKLNWTNYDSIPDFMDAASDVISDYRAEKKAGAKAEELAKKRFEAYQKDQKVEAVKSDAATTASDLNLDGLSSGTRIFTRAEIKAMSLDEYNQHQSAILAQSRAGYIQ